MNRAWIAAGVFAGAAVAEPSRLYAQDMSFGLEEAETEEAPATTEEAAPAGEGTAEEGGDVIGQLAMTPEDAAPEERQAAPRRSESIEEIYAVQRIYALRINRVELAPSIAFTVNDPYVSHLGLGVGLNYWWTNVLAVGLNFLWYQGLENESDLNFHVRRSTRLAVPITQYQLGAHLNFTYVPLYGKFAMFNKWIFQWDAYVVGGVGLMRTRPLPVVDPLVREFDFGNRIAFNAGLGIRIFITRFLSLFTELRDYVYFEKLENLNVALGSARDDASTWLANSATITNNVTVHFGMTLFFPFTFEYRLPK